jgi:tetratricopeptide (TPR) repeat protein
MDDKNLFKDVTITAQTVNIGGDVVGRDKETTTTLAPMTVAPTAAPTMVEPAFRLLVIVARPLDVSELPSIADQWELVRGLEQVEAPVSVTVLRPPTIEALRAELNNDYDAIHFDGHGDFGRVCQNCGVFISSSETAEVLSHCPACGTSLDAAPALGLLFFEKEDGTYEALPAPELTQMIAAPTQLVILSACRSAMGNEHSLAQTLIEGGVPAVLGMKEVVTVAATLAFFRPFYAALGTGATIAEATERARPALKGLPNPNSPTPTHKLPILFGAGTSARLCPPNSPRGRVQIEQEPLLVGVPHTLNFFGTFVHSDPLEGRKGLLARLARALLNDERLIVLTGAGGIGKTALASTGARRMAWRFPGGVFWRSAADIGDFRLDHLLNAFAAVFGQQFYTLPTPAKRDAVLRYLGDLRTTALVVVDNAETIRDPAVAKFLSEIPAPSAALMTTREAPEYGGLVIPVREMEPGEGIGFFAAEARRAKNDPTWGRALSTDDRARVLDIYRLLDGHPLALMLAAALLWKIDLAGVLALVKANPARGEVGRRFDFSYNPLPAEEKELLHRLAAFASHAHPKFIEQLCTKSELFPQSPLFSHLVRWLIKVLHIEHYFFSDDALPNWQPALTELVRKSFVEMLEFASEDAEGKGIIFTRYDLHPIMRQYAAGKAGLDAMRQHNFNAAKLLLAFARQFKQDFDMLEGELPNLLGVMDWADAERQVEGGKSQEEAARVVIKMIWAIGNIPDGILFLHGHWNEAKKRLMQAAEAAWQIKDVEGEAAFIGNAAIIAHQQGDIAGARAELEKVKAIFEKVGRKDQVASALHHLGWLAQDTGDLAEARQLYSQSLQLARELGDKQGTAKSLHQLGRLAQDTGNLAEARQLYSQSLQLTRELGDRAGEAKTLNALASITFAEGDHETARRLLNQSLKIAQQLGDKLQIAYASWGLSLVEEEEGNLADALSLIRQAEQLFTELGSPMRERARGVRERMEGNG